MCNWAESCVMKQIYMYVNTWILYFVNKVII